MASIHIPESAKPHLRLCKGPNSWTSDYVFSTYAEMVTFAASFGYYLSTVEGQKVPDKVRFLSSPNPIDLGVFRNTGLYSQLLIIALATSESMESISRQEAMAELIERYASLGFSEMSNRDWVDALLQAPEKAKQAEFTI